MSFIVEIPFSFNGKTGHLSAVTPERPPSSYHVNINKRYWGLLVNYSTGWAYKPQKDADYSAEFEAYLIDLMIAFWDGQAH